MFNKVLKTSNWQVLERERERGRTNYRIEKGGRRQFRSAFLHESLLHSSSLCAGNRVRASKTNIRVRGGSNGNSAIARLSYWLFAAHFSKLLAFLTGIFFDEENSSSRSLLKNSLKQLGIWDIQLTVHNFVSSIILISPIDPSLPEY